MSWLLPHFRLVQIRLLVIEIPNFRFSTSVQNSKPEIGLRFAPNSVSGSKRSLSDVCVGFPEACPAPIIDRILFRSKMIFQLRQHLAHTKISMTRVRRSFLSIKIDARGLVGVPRYLVCYLEPKKKIRKNPKPK